MSNKTYITLTEEEKRALYSYMEQYWGDTSRISAGGAIRHLAETAKEDIEQ